MNKDPFQKIIDTAVPPPSRWSKIEPYVKELLMYGSLMISVWFTYRGNW